MFIFIVKSIYKFYEKDYIKTIVEYDIENYEKFNNFLFINLVVF